VVVGVGRETFGQVLRARRLRAGLTQRELAGRAGVSVQAVRDIEAGRMLRPSPEWARQLTAAVAVPPAGPPPAVGVLRIEVLGPLSVYRGAEPVDAGAAKQRSLLGLLALQPNRVVPRDEIVDVLWGTHPPESWQNLVSTYVSRLRKLLGAGSPDGPGSPVGRVHGGCELAVGTEQLDQLRFTALVTRAAPQPAAAVEVLRQALALWRGPVLADLDSQLRQHPAAVALAGQRVAAALAFADLGLRLGRYAEVVRELRVVGQVEPLHEGLHARLILALAGAGEPATALLLFAQVRGRLADELGVPPGDELAAAHLRVLRRDVGEPAPRPAGAGPVTTAAPGAPAGRVRPGQLPAEVAGFVGRDGYLRQLDAVRPGPDGGGTVPVAVIAGAAGVGKTALAVHWAHRMRGRFTDGDLYVDLRGHDPGGPLRPVEALARFLRALGVPAERAPLGVDEAAAMFRSLLAGRSVLLLLDDAGSAEQVRPLLPGSPGCMVVVTSRNRLGGLVARDGARRLTLDVLTPAEARRLLDHVLGADRVAAEPVAAAELARLCACLPLALRIAAANLTAYPDRRIAAHAAELAAGNRLTALSTGEDDQSAVRAAFDLSYQALDPASRRMFRLLGLNPGPDIGTPTAAALAVTTTADAARLLDRLTAAHLIDYRPPDRRTFHDLLRLYATERALAEDAARDRDAATRRLYQHYLGGTEAAAALLYPGMLRLPGPTPAMPAGAGPAFSCPADAVAWLDAERAGLVAAVARADDSQLRPLASRIAFGLRGYFWMRGNPVDWLALAEAAVTAARADSDPRAEAAALLSRADSQFNAGNHRQSLDDYAAAVALARQAGWLDAEATALANLGGSCLRSSQPQQAAEHLAAAHAVNQQAGNRSGEAATLGNLGTVYGQLGRLHDAADQHEQALRILQEIGHRPGEAYERANLGESLHLLGRLGDATEQLTRSLALARELGDRGAEQFAAGSLAELYSHYGRHEEATELATTALAMALTTNDPFREALASLMAATVQRAAGNVADAVQHGERALEMARQAEDCHAIAAASIGLAHGHLRLGDPGTAARYAAEATAIARSVGYRDLEGQARAAAAEIHLHSGDAEQAAEAARQAAAIHEETGNRPGQARALCVLGHARQHMHGPDAAVPCWQQALDLFTDIGSPDADALRPLLTVHS
jgi:DNA-binding SARP family transcriptional activator/tetratricopeptide (TPR) repeat protein/DNA-binding XRE family transcriptional regulator